jgi:hypothetical protein
LNRRPLGYEGKFSHHGNQDEPTRTNEDTPLLNGITVTFWLISVAVLHSRFIGFDRPSRLRLTCNVWHRTPIATRGVVSSELSNLVIYDVARSQCPLAPYVLLNLVRNRTVTNSKGGS